MKLLVCLITSQFYWMCWVVCSIFVSNVTLKFGICSFLPLNQQDLLKKTCGVQLTEIAQELLLVSGQVWLFSYFYVSDLNSSWQLLKVASLTRLRNQGTKPHWYHICLSPDKLICLGVFFFSIWPESYVYYLDQAQIYQPYVSESCWYWHIIYWFEYRCYYNPNIFLYEAGRFLGGTVSFLWVWWGGKENYSCQEMHGSLTGNAQC